MVDPVTIPFNVAEAEQAVRLILAEQLRTQSLGRRNKVSPSGIMREPQHDLEQPRHAMAKGRTIEIPRADGTPINGFHRSDG
jgi:hypothetical protein